MADGSQVMENGSPADRRLYRRYPVDCPVLVFPVSGSSTIAGRLTEISLSSCRVATDNRFPPEMLTRVEVEFDLRGVVLRSPGVCLGSRGPRHFVIRFLDLSERKLNQLAELIAEVDESPESGS